MSRREHRIVMSANERAYPAPPPSKCAKFLYYTWKLCSVVFSHLVMISLVVAYCILGAVTFEKLESEHEKEVKKNISYVRENTTQCIWAMTRSAPLLNQSNWTSEVVYMLKDFENSILYEIKVRGWDGFEDIGHTQWTFVGALFYSIIVITTIGYGHIAPKTQTGKIVTIFYAILGIPLMLLCLSNIGDVMASSFRFLYWRACCYMCTRSPPKRRRRHHSSMRRSVRGRTSSTRRKAKPLQRAHSDTDFRYRDSGYSSGRARRRAPPSYGGARAPRTRSQPPLPSTYHNAQGNNYDYRTKSPVPYDRYECNQRLSDNDEFPKISLPLQDLAAALKDLENHHQTKSRPDLRSKSLPRQGNTFEPDFKQRYYDDDVFNPESIEMHDLRDVDYENFKERKALEKRDWRDNRQNIDEYEIYRDGGYDPEDEDFEFDTPKNIRTIDHQRRSRGQSEHYDKNYGYEKSPRNRRACSSYSERDRRYYDQREWDRDGKWPDIETGRNRRLRRLHTTDESTRPGYQNRHSPSPCPDDWSDEEPPLRHKTLPPNWSSRQLNAYSYQDTVHKEEIKPVPIWLCVLLVASYIVAGTFLFKSWEGWSYLDAAYFCFITLTTIGFGDFVPAQSKLGLSLTTSTVDAAAAVHSIALCSLYLLFGIALLAMSFNLVQEEVRANVAAVATRLGIIKSHDDPQYDSDMLTDEY